MDFKDNPAGLPQLGFTHAGRFHADDVFSAALLRILRPDMRIYRGFQVPKGFSGIVFDIGDGPFDHHAKGSPRRANGAPYASFGLLWREYGRFFLPEAEAARFDEKFIQPIDVDDNNGTGNLLAVLLGSFNPTWDEENPDMDAAFFEAVGVAEKILYHRLKSLAAVERGKEAVQKGLADMKDGVVVLPVYIPWKPVLVETSAEFVIFPSGRGGYSVQCIPKDYNGKTGHKVPMPVAWRGKGVAELREISGIADIKFCHASGFMATSDSLAGALDITRVARAEWEKNVAAQKAKEEAQAAGVAKPAT